MDISGSMLARDFKPDRLEASKNVATEFISGRPYDRIGLVVFSGESFTQCPLTTDHAVLINLMRELQSGMIEDELLSGRPCPGNKKLRILMQLVKLLFC
jgi:Ca-activated chloride channel family protein